MFIKLRREGGGFLSSFLIAKFLKTKVGDDFKLKSLKNFEFLIETKTEKESEKLITTKIIGQEPVEFVPIKNLNQTRGTIKSYSLKYHEDHEIMEQLREVGVTEFKRFLRKGNTRPGEKGAKPGFTNTGVFLLTFNSSDRPEKILIGHEQFDVQIFVPRPLQCNQCFKFGHTKRFCSNKKVCGNCGEEDHDMENCVSENPRCVNCNLSHNSYSKDCSTYKEETEIAQIKESGKITYNMARAQYIKSQNDTANTYAEVTKTTSSEFETKLDLLIAAVTEQTKQINRLSDQISQFLTTKCTRHETETGRDETTTSAIDRLDPLIKTIEKQQRYLQCLEENFEKIQKNPKINTVTLRKNAKAGGVKKPA